MDAELYLRGLLRKRLQAVAALEFEGGILIKRRREIEKILDEYRGAANALIAAGLVHRDIAEDMLREASWATVARLDREFKRFFAKSGLPEDVLGDLPPAPSRYFKLDQ